MFPLQKACFAQKLSFFQTSWILRSADRKYDVVGFRLSATIVHVAAPTVCVLGGPLPAANPLSYKDFSAAPLSIACF
jgi:hypothetical protein